MTDISRVIVWVCVSLLSVACGPVKDAATGAGGESTGSSGAADGGETADQPSPTSALNGDEGSTTGATAGGSTDEGDVVTTGADDEATSFGDTEGTPSVLEACALAEPCDAIWVYCDYDGCASDIAMADDVTVCTWTQLRDGAAHRLRIAETYTGDLNKVAVVVGDPERTLLLDTFYGTKSHLRTCKLATPAFFQGCIDAPGDDDCYLTDRWFIECEDVPALACPGA